MLTIDHITLVFAGLTMGGAAVAWLLLWQDRKAGTVKNLADTVEALSAEVRQLSRDLKEEKEARRLGRQKCGAALAVLITQLERAGVSPDRSILEDFK